MASLKDLNVQFGSMCSWTNFKRAKKKSAQAIGARSKKLTLEHGVSGGFILCSDFSPLRRRWYLLKCSAPCS